MAEPRNLSSQAQTYARTRARILLAGRKGHGGGPCMTRVLDEAKLYALLAIAFDDGRASAAAIHEAAR